MTLDIDVSNTLRIVETMPALDETLDEVLKAYRVDKWLYAQAPRVLTTHVKNDEVPSHYRVSSCGYPEDFVEKYDRELSRQDPSPQIACQSSWPLKWSSLPEGDFRFYRRFDEACFERGWLIPVHGPRKVSGYMLVVFDEGVDDGKIPVAIQSVQSACIWAHLKYAELLLPQSVETIKVSQREKQVLNELAQGKTNREISEALSVSPLTVDTFVRRLFENLNVSDRVSAVLRGIHYGVI